jgi:hypothetical protein
MAPGAKVVYFDNDDTEDHFVIHENKYASKNKRSTQGTYEQPVNSTAEAISNSKRFKPPTQKQERDLLKRRQELLEFRKNLPVYSGKSFHLSENGNNNRELTISQHMNKSLMASKRMTL